MKMLQGNSTPSPDRNARAPGRFYDHKAAFIKVPTPGAGRTYYFDALHDCLTRISVTANTDEEVMRIEEGLERLREIVTSAHADGGRVFFVGNGGSAGIASHLAIDYSKNGGIRALALNDPAALTCLSNDFGYEYVFAKQLEYQATDEDVAIIISSSGRSPNMLAAADAARVAQVRALVTLSGMNPNNRLRGRGNLNFYVPCMEYGLIELSHLALLHSVISV